MNSPCTTFLLAVLFIVHLRVEPSQRRLPHRRSCCFWCKLQIAQSDVFRTKSIDEAAHAADCSDLRLPCAGCRRTTLRSPSPTVQQFPSGSSWRDSSSLDEIAESSLSRSPGSHCSPDHS